MHLVPGDVGDLLLSSEALPPHSMARGRLRLTLPGRLTQRFARKLRRVQHPQADELSSFRKGESPVDAAEAVLPQAGGEQVVPETPRQRLLPLRLRGFRFSFGDAEPRSPRPDRSSSPARPFAPVVQAQNAITHPESL